MSITVISLWRVAKHTAEYRADDLSGGGAKLTGGRWNSKGHAVIYASTTIALSTLETLAHLGDNIAIRNAFLVRINVPVTIWDKREYITPEDLGPTWVSEPPGATTIDFGDGWINSGTAALLMVPSVIVPEEFNILINPAHADIRKIRATVVRQYVYDSRL